MMRLRTVMMAAALVLVGQAEAQDGLVSARPQGFYGVGHDEHHQHYMALKNAAGGSCCSGAECRPTQARWNGATWDVMVNGKWRRLSPHDGYKVLYDATLEAQGRPRWDAQAHVCASKLSEMIYCIVPPASGG